MLKDDYTISKRNVLNEIRANSMSLQELRFFSIYLAKINPRNINSRVVRFSLNEFQRIMELGKLNINHMRNVIDSLLCKVVGIPLDTGGYERFQLFKKCIFTKDENNDWYIEIDSHDDALPLMFEFKERYFTYQLWNILKLKSSNQLRMYEILKQYEKLGERIISITELKELLGIDRTEYQLFNNFKVHVLDICQKAIAECTDIKFTYEPTGRRGKGGKILHLMFTITKNTDYTDQLSLEEFIQNQDIIDVNEEESDENTFTNENLDFLSEACSNEFSRTEMQILNDLISQIVPYTTKGNAMIERYDYLSRKYNELLWRAEKKKILNRFGYLKKLLEVDISK